jgi:hypothetical protein
MLYTVVREKKTMGYKNWDTIAQYKEVGGGLGGKAKIRTRFGGGFMPPFVDSTAVAAA